MQPWAIRPWMHLPLPCHRHQQPHPHGKYRLSLANFTTPTPAFMWSLLTLDSRLSGGSAYYTAMAMRCPPVSRARSPKPFKHSHLGPWHHDGGGGGGATSGIQSNAAVGDGDGDGDGGRGWSRGDGDGDGDGDGTGMAW